MKSIKLSEIVISSSFAESVPSEQKVQKYKSRFAKTGKQSKYLVLDNENVLVDGYIQYLILKENNVEEAKLSDVASSVVRRNRLIGHRPLHMYMALIRIANVQKSSCGEFLKVGLISQRILKQEIQFIVVQSLVLCRLS